jgi:hypothetical protein
MNGIARNWMNRILKLSKMLANKITKQAINSVVSPIVFTSIQ